jgi:predicted dehydrogenase
MRIAVVSFAHVHAESYLRELASRSDVDVIGCDPDGTGPDRGRDLAARFGVPYAATLADVVAWRPDAVVVASENSHHRPLVEWAAGHGLDVLCEKPIATSVADGIAMVEACERAGVALMIAYPARFSPAVAAVQTALSGAALGPVRTLYGSNNGKSPVSARDWFGDPQRAGGGSIIDHTVHLADLLDLLFDGDLPVDVFAAGNDLLFPELAVESAGIVSVRYDGGRVATIECGWSQPSADPRWGGLDLTLVGDEGILELDLFPTVARGYLDGEGVALGAGIDLDALMIDEFISALRTGRSPQPDGRSALRSLAIVEAAYRSIDSGEVIHLDPAVRRAIAVA